MTDAKRTKKLVLYGDSLLARLGKEQMVKLETKLPNHAIYNCAAPGWNTNDGSEKGEYVAQLKPEVVVLSFGTNDAAPWKLVQIDVFRKNLHQILQTFAQAHIIFFLPPPVEESELFPLPNRLLKQYYEAALEITQELKIDVVPSWDIFSQLLAKGEKFHIEDGVHLNDLGYAKLIDNVSKLILARTAKQPRINPRRGV